MLRRRARTVAEVPAPRDDPRVVGARVGEVAREIRARGGERGRRRIVGIGSAASVVPDRGEHVDPPCAESVVRAGGTEIVRRPLHPVELGHVVGHAQRVEQHRQTRRLGRSHRGSGHERVAGVAVVVGREDVAVSVVVFGVSAGSGQLHLGSEIRVAREVVSPVGGAHRHAFRERRGVRDGAGIVPGGAEREDAVVASVLERLLLGRRAAAAPEADVEHARPVVHRPLDALGHVRSAAPVGEEEEPSRRPAHLRDGELDVRSVGDPSDALFVVRVRGGDACDVRPVAVVVGGVGVVVVEVVLREHPARQVFVGGEDSRVHDPQHGRSAELAELFMGFEPVHVRVRGGGRGEGLAGAAVDLPVVVKIPLVSEVRVEGLRTRAQLARQAERPDEVGLGELHSRMAAQRAREIELVAHWHVEGENVEDDLLVDRSAEAPRDPARLEAGTELHQQTAGDEGIRGARGLHGGPRRLRRGLRRNPGVTAAGDDDRRSEEQEERDGPIHVVLVRSGRPGSDAMSRRAAFHARSV